MIRSRWSMPLAVMLPMLVVLWLSTVPTTTASTCEHGVVVIPPLRGAYHAANPGFGGSEDVVTGLRISRFEQLAQKRIAWAYFSDNWIDGITFPAAAVATIRARHGMIPFVRMMPRSGWNEYASDPIYGMQRIIDGQFDGQLRSWARSARASGGPLMVEFGTEVNGAWFPWNGRWNGGGRTDSYGDPAWPDGPERFRDAYRHIVRLFRAEGANNVTWVFHVDAEADPDTSWNRMRWYYPGDSFVDWIGLSVYGADDPSYDAVPFARQLGPGYREAAGLSRSKPLAVLEWGIVRNPARWNQRAWIRGAFTTLRSGEYPRIRALAWWNERWRNDDGSISDLRINSSSTTLAAYRTGIAERRYRPSARTACRGS